MKIVKVTDGYDLVHEGIVIDHAPTLIDIKNLKEMY